MAKEFRVNLLYLSGLRVTANSIVTTGMTGHSHGQYALSSATGQFISTAQTGAFVPIAQTGHVHSQYALSSSTGQFLDSSETGIFVTTSQTGHIHSQYALSSSTGQLVDSSKTGQFVVAQKTGSFLTLSSGDERYLGGITTRIVEFQGGGNSELLYTNDDSCPIGTFVVQTTGYIWGKGPRIPLDRTLNYEAEFWYNRVTTGSPTNSFYAVVSNFDASGDSINGDGADWYYPILGKLQGTIPTGWNRFGVIVGPQGARNHNATGRFISVGFVTNFTTGEETWRWAGFRCVPILSGIVTNLSTGQFLTSTINNRPDFAYVGAASPFTVSSSYKVTNLNADSLDGYDASDFVLTSGTGQFVTTAQTGHIHQQYALNSATGAFLTFASGDERYWGGIFHDTWSVISNSTNVQYTTADDCPVGIDVLQTSGSHVAYGPLIPLDTSLNYEVEAYGKRLTTGNYVSYVKIYVSEYNADKAHVSYGGTEFYDIPFALNANQLQVETGVWKQARAIVGPQGAKNHISTGKFISLGFYINLATGRELWQFAGFKCRPLLSGIVMSSQTGSFITTGENRIIRFNDIVQNVQSTATVPTETYYYPNVAVFTSESRATGSVVLNTPIIRNKNVMVFAHIRGYRYGSVKIENFYAGGYPTSNSSGNIDGVNGTVYSPILTDLGNSPSAKSIGINKSGYFAIAINRPTDVTNYDRYTADFWVTEVAGNRHPISSTGWSWSLETGNNCEFGDITNFSGTTFVPVASSGHIHSQYALSAGTGQFVDSSKTGQFLTSQVTIRPDFAYAGAASPFTVSSSYKVVNLNADTLDGYDSTAFALVSGTGQFVDTSRTGVFVTTGESRFIKLAGYAQGFAGTVYYPNVANILFNGNTTGAIVLNTPLIRTVDRMFYIQVKGFDYNGKIENTFFGGYLWNGGLGNLDGISGRIINPTILNLSNNYTTNTKSLGINKSGYVALSIKPTGSVSNYDRYVADVWVCYPGSIPIITTGWTWSIETGVHCGFGDNYAVTGTAFINSTQTGHIHQQYYLASNPNGYITSASISGAGVSRVGGLSGVITLTGGGNVSVYTGGGNIIYFSGVTGDLVSQGMTGQFAPIAQTGHIHSQYALSDETGQFISTAQTGQFVPSGLTGQFISTAQTGAFAPIAQTGHIHSQYVTSSATGQFVDTSMTGHIHSQYALSVGTGQFISTAQTGAFAPIAQTGHIHSQYALVAETGQYITTAQTGHIHSQYALAVGTGQFIVSQQTGGFLTLDSGDQRYLAGTFYDIWSTTSNPSSIQYLTTDDCPVGNRVIQISGANYSFGYKIPLDISQDYELEAWGKRLTTGTYSSYISIFASEYNPSGLRIVYGSDFYDIPFALNNNQLNIATGIWKKCRAIVGPNGAKDHISTGSFISIGFYVNLSSGQETWQFAGFKCRPIMSGTVISSQTGQFITTSQTGVFAPIAQTGHIHSQYALSVGTGQFISTAQTGQFAPSGLTGQFVTTSQTGHIHSQYLLIINTGHTHPQYALAAETGQFISTAQTGDFAPIEQTGHIHQQYALSAGTGQFVSTSQTGHIHSQYALAAGTGQFISTAQTGTFAPIAQTGHIHSQYALSAGTGQFISTAQTGAFAPIAQTGHIHSQYVLSSSTGQFAPSGMTGQFVTTAQTGHIHSQYALSVGTGQFISSSQTGHIHSQYTLSSATGNFLTTGESRDLRLDGFNLMENFAQFLPSQKSTATYYYPNVATYTATESQQGAIVLNTPVFRTSNLASLIHIRGFNFKEYKIENFYAGAYTSVNGSGNIDGLQGYTQRASILDLSDNGYVKSIGINKSGCLAVAINVNNSTAYYDRYVADVWVSNMAGEINIQKTGWSWSLETGDNFDFKHIQRFTGSTFVLPSGTGQFISTAQTGAFAPIAQTGHIHSQYVTSSVTGQFVDTSMTGHIHSQYALSVGTGQFVSTTQTGHIHSQYALSVETGQFISTSQTGQFAPSGLTGQFITTSQTGHTHSQYALSAGTGQFVSTAQTGHVHSQYALSSATGQFVDSSETGIFVTTAQTGAFAPIVQTGHIHSQYALSAGTGQFISTSQTGQFAPSGMTGQFVTTSQTGHIHSQYALSSLTGQFISTAQTGHVHSQYITNAATGEFIDSSKTGQFLTSTINIQPVFNAAGSPFTVVSSVKVTNLNADSVDGYDSTSFALVSNTGQFISTAQTGAFAPIAQTGHIHSQYALVAGTGQFISTAQTGAFAPIAQTGHIHSQYLTNAGTGEFVDSSETGQFLTSTTNIRPAFNSAGSPFTVASSTAVTNLNADALDGYQASSFILTTDTGQFAPIAQTGHIHSQYALSSATGQFLTSTINIRPVFNYSNGTDSPMQVLNSYKVNNLNVDYLDGYSADAFVLAADTGQFIDTSKTGQFLTSTTNIRPAFNSAGSPFTVTSSTSVTNFNADLLDGYEATSFALTTSTGQFITTAQTGHIHSQYLSAAGTGQFVDSSKTGQFLTSTINIRPIFTYVGAASPMQVFNSTKVDNLNADLLDGNEATAFVSTTSTGQFITTALTGHIHSQYLSSAGTGQFVDSSKTGQFLTSTVNIRPSFAYNGAASPFTATSTVVVTNLNADLLDGVHAAGFVTTVGSVMNSYSGAIIIQGTGGITVDASVANTITLDNSSDRRLKKNIRRFKNASKLVKKLPVVQWEFNGKGGTRNGDPGIGLIAQDVKSIIPKCVHTHKGKLTAKSETTDIYGMNIPNLVGILTKAVQELMEENEKLSARIEKLECKTK